MDNETIERCVMAALDTQERMAVALEHLAAEEHRRVELLEQSVKGQTTGLEQAKDQHDEQKRWWGAALERDEQRRQIETLPCDRILRDIRIERWRQVEEGGFGPGHDDRHQEGELGDAAAFYAAVDADGPSWPWAHNAREHAEHVSRKNVRPRRRQLIIAGALIVAELERLDRAEKKVVP
jgi:hypothetical protein